MGEAVVKGPPPTDIIVKPGSIVGIKKRLDLSEAKVSETVDEIVVEMGEYVNRAGMHIPVTLRTRKGGLIHRLWLEEAERRKRVAVKLIDDGKTIEIIEDNKVIDVETEVKEVKKLE